MPCLHNFHGICLIPASGQTNASFFGFAEFISAFALLAIVFTIADVQYRFRIRVSPLPLPSITFWALGVIGFGTLVTDLWVSQGWLIIDVPYITYGVIQGLFAAGFLIIAMAWLYFAFLKPPVFSKWNSKKYAQVLFTYLLRGSDSELPVIAMEVGRSADELIGIFANHQKDFSEQRLKRERGEKINFNPGNYASEILSMIGNRKFCRHVVASSPGTAIRLFQAASSKKVYSAPFGQFAKNISTEAILNPDSNLYHEDSHFQSGLFGELKPFTQAIYGSYRLVETLGRNFYSSPLDVDFNLTSWNAAQLKAYARAVLTTCSDRLIKGKWSEHSFSLARAFSTFERACWDVYKLDGLEDGDPDIRERLDVCVRFVTDLIDLLEKHEEKIVINHLKPDNNRMSRDIYDDVADLMSEIIYNASGIEKPVWPCWHIQHNTVWMNFFDRSRDSKSERIIGYKLRRLIYEEIIEFDKYADLKSFKAARYLGICLNCMGVQQGDKKLRNLNTAALHMAVLSWVKKNYVSLHENHPTVAEACLMGGVSYDTKNLQLIKTYAARADREPAKDVLSLSK